MWRTALKNLNRESIATLVAREREAGTTWGQKLQAWRHGFSSASYRHYRLSENDYRDYLPDTALHRHGRAVGAFQRVLRDKVLFGVVAGAFVRVPRLVAIVAAGSWVGVAHQATRQLDSWLDAADDGPAVILKPACGGRGRGVHRLEVAGGRTLLDARELPRSDVAAFVAGLDDYVAVEAVTQAPYAAEVFPGAVNTLRIVTMIDPADGRSFILGAVHRFGVQASAPTDNVSRGGVVAKLDLVTGELGPAWGDSKLGSTGPVDHHPETGTRITGLHVPDWDGVQREVLALAGALGFLLYVGWDVAITPDGPVLLEGNHGPDRGMQRHFPYLKDPRARRFFEHHGTI